MAKRPTPGPTQSHADPVARVDAFAATVLRRVADGIAQRSPKLAQDLFDRLKAAAVDGGPEDCVNLIDDMFAAGVTAEEIADYYIPAVARDLGTDWETDDLAFVQVTIGTSRLQGMLRALGPEWRADEITEPERRSAAALVLIAPEVYHTLGVSVLAGQLRRSGLTVRLLLGADRGQIKAVMANTDYDLALVSASIGESLESIRKLVKDVRELAHNRPPIIVGGTILNQNMDVGAVTGADYATSNLSDALRFCGLHIGAPIIQKHEHG